MKFILLFATIRLQQNERTLRKKNNGIQSFPMNCIEETDNTKNYYVINSTLSSVCSLLDHR